MFPKLLFITVCLGALGLALLVNRQQRIETTHEMSVIYRRMNDHERTIWRMRAEIARTATPRQLQEATRNLPGNLVRFIDSHGGNEIDPWRVAETMERDAQGGPPLNFDDEPAHDWGG